MGFFGAIEHLFLGGGEDQQVPHPAAAPAAPANEAAPEEPTGFMGFLSKASAYAGTALEVFASADVAMQQQAEREAAAKKEAETEACTEAAKSLFIAMDGIGTDEDSIMSALRGKTPEEVAEIKRL